MTALAAISCALDSNNLFANASSIYPSSVKVHNPVKRAVANYFTAGDVFLLFLLLSLRFRARRREEKRSSSPFESGNFELGFRGVCPGICVCALHKQMTICFWGKHSQARCPLDTCPTYTLWQYSQRKLWDHPEIHANTRRRHDA